MQGHVFFQIPGLGPQFSQGLLLWRCEIGSPEISGPRSGGDTARSGSSGHAGRADFHPSPRLEIPFHKLKCVFQPIAHYFDSSPDDVDYVIRFGLDAQTRPAFVIVLVVGFLYPLALCSLALRFGGEDKGCAADVWVPARFGESRRDPERRLRGQSRVIGLGGAASDDLHNRHLGGIRLSYTPGVTSKPRLTSASSSMGKADRGPRRGLVSARGMPCACPGSSAHSRAVRFSGGGAVVIAIVIAMPMLPFRHCAPSMALLA